jgi:ADP-ribosyl-[dinitrogen reductase] hydrolase
MTNNRILDKMEGFLVGMAIGDSLGAVQEQLGQAKKDRIFGQITDHLVLEPHERRYRTPYAYTDDTQMAIITIKSFIENGKNNPADIARRLLEKKDRLRGIGKGTRKALENLARGISYTESGQERPGNSPALRCAPIGFTNLYSPRKINEDVRRNTTITHTNPISIAAATATAHFINHLVSDSSLEHLLSHVSGKVKAVDADFYKKIRDLDSFPSVGKIGTSSYALESVPAAFYIFMKNPDDVERGIVEAINAGGDSDSIGALVGAFYGTYHGLEKLPKKWSEKVENYTKLVDKMEEFRTAVG